MAQHPIEDVGPDAGGVLNGARVGLLEGRMGRELSDLVRRHGGIPVAAPALREVPVDAPGMVATLIDELEAGRIDIAVLLTGVGVDALVREAERLGRREALESGLAGVATLCRGPKPRAALRRSGLSCSAMVPEPYTTADVVEALEAMDSRGRRVAVLHYGERSVAIPDALRSMGCTVLDLCVYEWALPDDTAPLERLVEEVVAGHLEAVAFTSQVQVRHLFLVAARTGRTLKLMNALNERTAVAAVGPTCATALRAAGVEPRVVPENPKMGPMILALGEYLAAAGSRPHPT